MPTDPMPDHFFESVSRIINGWEQLERLGATRPYEHGDASAVAAVNDEISFGAVRESRWKRRRD
jgi:hypothetical protein